MQRQAGGHHGTDLRRHGANEHRTLAARGLSVANVHGLEPVLLRPMIDLPRELVVRPLVGAGCDHASCLGRYDDATARLSRLRNDGNAATAPKATQAIITLCRIMIPPSLSLESAPLRPTMPSFRRIAQRISVLRDRPRSFHNLVWLNLREHLRLICRLIFRSESRTPSCRGGDSQTEDLE